MGQWLKLLVPALAACALALALMMMSANNPLFG
jgi:hypothetical protein